ncbi:hypothetical protein SAMN03080601_00290 [Alkalitalea saponilacus]|uniref:Uncharacterized protein n=1 Tax=Alkalitalea saponilacus TaxID=889453 RepID=A0A1T5AJA2_9BACT|nr:hypothetical protein SAMN03080601_00290 [Alkalitalea saponilacus]
MLLYKTILFYQKNVLIYHSTRDQVKKTAETKFYYYINSIKNIWL